MQGRITSVRINAVLEINDEDAEVLEFVLGYSLSQVFYDHCSHEIGLERIEKVFDRLRSACAKVTRAKKRALKALNPDQDDPREV